ncbi:MAG: glycosyltransferase family 4 protein [Arenibacter troitsensis]|nr:glycosyltransferase family 4 protein [Arenibacter troitsensis]
MIKSFMANGYKVFAGAPNFQDNTSQALSDLGVVTIEFPLQRTGLNPWKDLLSVLKIRNIIIKNEIDLLFPYTIKPVIYGSLAGRFTGTPVISLITGLGFTFSKSSIKARVLQKVTEVLYKIALSKNNAIIFQNSDDVALFRKKGILNKNQNTHIVDGSGIHLERYPFRENNKVSDKIIFVFVARLIREKGADLFMDAAQKLKTEFPKAEFHIIGNIDNSPSSISPNRLSELNERKIITYHGFKKNVENYLTNSDVFVLPTYYREGIPRSILEALSIGMPIITTNTPGCKETVLRNENGILVEPKQLNELILGIRFILENPAAIGPMGNRSRKLAEKRFNVDIINDMILKIINNNL